MVYRVYTHIDSLSSRGGRSFPWPKAFLQRSLFWLHKLLRRTCTSFCLIILCKVRVGRYNNAGDIDNGGILWTYTLIVLDSCWRMHSVVRAWFLLAAWSDTTLSISNLKQAHRVRRKSKTRSFHWQTGCKPQPGAIMWVHSQQYRDDMAVGCMERGEEEERREGRGERERGREERERAQESGGA